MAIFNDSQSKQEIFDLMDKFEESSLSELELSVPAPQLQYVKIKMVKSSREYSPEITKVIIENESEIGGVKSQDKKKKIITAPLVGTFYSSASPDSEPYVKAGDKIKKGMVLCIIEAMKTMNEIESETDGEIAEILAGNGSPVEYGQPLFALK